MAYIWKRYLLFERKQLWSELKNSFARLVYAYNSLHWVSNDGILFSNNVYNSLFVSLHPTYRLANVKRKKPKFDRLIVSSTSSSISQQSSFWLYTFPAWELMYNLSLWLSIFGSSHCFDLRSKALLSHRMLGKLDKKWVKLVSFMQKTNIIIWGQWRWSWKCSWFLSGLKLFSLILFYNIVYFQFIIRTFKWE